jgi:hypothetical protein
MLGVLAAAAVLVASLAIASCGEDEGFSDKKIADAIGVKGDEVGGDPFCVISDYLNDPDEVEKADKRDKPAISSARGAVGVVVEPPFPDDCELKVRRALNQLDPKKEE